MRNAQSLQMLGSSWRGGVQSAAQTAGAVVVGCLPSFISADMSRFNEVNDRQIVNGLAHTVMAHITKYKGSPG